MQTTESFPTFPKIFPIQIGTTMFWIQYNKIQLGTTHKDSLGDLMQKGDA